MRSMPAVIHRALHGRFQPTARYASTSPSYEDRALQWARANPGLAQKCLDLPSDKLYYDSGASTVDQSSIQIRNLDDYLRRRGWEFPVDLKDHLTDARALSSHVLSAPLTVASQFAFILTTQKTQRWCCVGARAEASLPSIYWRELLIVLDWMNGPMNCEIHLDFLGPEMPIARRKSETLKYKDATVRLNWLQPGKFHELAPDLALAYDKYILFNPGLAHPHLANDWRPTLDMLFSIRSAEERRKRSMLLTAHSQEDAKRDAELLAKYLGLPPAYVLNPFASRITYQDPFDHSYIVQPNHYVCCIQDNT